MSRDDLPTLILCLACGGHYETLEETGTGYRATRCRWCTEGGMTRSQAQVWTSRGKQHDEPGPRKSKAKKDPEAR